MLVTRFVIPFEVVGFVLLGALIGGITIARAPDTTRGRAEGLSDMTVIQFVILGAALFSFGSTACS